MLSNKSTMQSLIDQVCDMANREQFTMSLTALGLVAKDPSQEAASNSSKPSPPCLTKYAQVYRTKINNSKPSPPCLTKYAQVYRTKINNSKPSPPCLTKYAQVYCTEINNSKPSPPCLTKYAQVYDRDKQ